MAGIGAPIGNDYAKKGKLIGDAVRKVATQSPYKLQKAIEAQLNAASEGDLAAMTFLRDTLDGKPHQSSDISVSGSLQDTLASIVASEIPND